MMSNSNIGSFLLSGLEAIARFILTAFAVSLGEGLRGSEIVGLKNTAIYGIHGWNSSKPYVYFLTPTSCIWVSRLSVGPWRGWRNCDQRTDACGPQRMTFQLPRIMQNFIISKKGVMASSTLPSHQRPFAFLVYNNNKKGILR